MSIRGLHISKDISSDLFHLGYSNSSVKQACSGVCPYHKVAVGAKQHAQQDGKAVAFRAVQPRVLLLALKLTSCATSVKPLNFSEPQREVDSLYLIGYMHAQHTTDAQEKLAIISGAM